MNEATTDGGAAERWVRFGVERASLRRCEATAEATPTPLNEQRLREAITRHAAARNRLAENYLPLVHRVAERIRARLPIGVELGDLLAEGAFGLMEAIETYDPARGFKFETFAPRRVRGAILDYLRSIDWVPRLVRQRWREVQGVVADFAKHHGRQPTDEEIIERIRGPKPDLTFTDGKVVTMNPLARGDRDRWSDATDGAGADRIGDRRAQNPLTVAHRRQMKEYLLRTLNQSERLIVILNYYEGMTLAEVGRVLDISESRVSQLRTSILERLRARLSEEEATKMLVPEAVAH